MSELADVIASLAQTPPRIASKYFYDAYGSALFSQITTLDAYYPTRIERQILTDNRDALVAWLGTGAVLIEPGSGTSQKVRLLLDGQPLLAAYVPIDIDSETLGHAAQELRAAYPGLEVHPRAADISQPDFSIAGFEEAARRVVFYPGSTLGNMTPTHAEAFLARLCRDLQSADGLLIGVDLHKDATVLERAYNDPEGVTAAFNKNALTHLNARFASDFDPDAFEHVAVYNSVEQRIEMYLQAVGDQRVTIGGETFTFPDGQRIHTENSYKYLPAQLEDMAERAGFSVECFYTNPEGWFGVWTMRVR